MDVSAAPRSRAARVRRNLRAGHGPGLGRLAGVADSLLGARDDQRRDAADCGLSRREAWSIASPRRALHAIGFSDMVPILVGLWLATARPAAVGAYMGYGRNLFVRRVQLEAERRLLDAGVEGGHRALRQLRLARSPGARQARRLVAARRSHVVGPRPLRQHRHHRADGDDCWPACTTCWSMLAIAAALLSLALERRDDDASCTSSSTRRRPRSASASISAICWCSRAPRRRSAPTCWPTICSAGIGDRSEDLYQQRVADVPLGDADRRC